MTASFITEANSTLCSKCLQIFAQVRHIQSSSPEVIWHITLNHSVQIPNPLLLDAQCPEYN